MVLLVHEHFAANVAELLVVDLREAVFIPFKN